MLNKGRKIEKEDLIRILEGDLALIPLRTRLGYQCKESEVAIYPHYVKASLERYLSREWSAEQLTSWGDFIRYSPCYTSPHSGEIDFDDYYDDVWEVLHCIANPHLEGEITLARVNEFMGWLKKYENDPRPI